MDKNVIYAVMRQFKGWDIDNGTSDDGIAKISDRLYKALIAADMREYGISKEVADIAIRIWGVSDVAALNNTFHKSFSTVEKSDYNKLVYQQLLNYFTTYGAELFGCYDSNYIYIPEENLEVPEIIRGMKLAIIRPYTGEQIKEKVLALARHNAGLSGKTLDDITVLVRHYCPGITAGEVASLPNKELKVRLYNDLGITPLKGDEFLRLVMYKATQQSLLIKNREMIDSLRRWSNSNDGRIYIRTAFGELDSIRLAKSYHRYHEYWLALKQKAAGKKMPAKSKEINAFVNKISRLADKYNVPLPLNTMQNILDPKISIADIETAVINANNVQLLKTWGYMEFVRSLPAQDKYALNYSVRNNTVWTTEKALKHDEALAKKMKPITEELRRRFSHLAGKTFYIPNNIYYPIYTSGKKTVGAIPQGTVISLPVSEISDNRNIIFAIHWQDTDDRVDLDIHAQTNSSAVGWNSGYRTDDCQTLYSGDMTAAPKPDGATEAILMKGSMQNTEVTFKVNNFTQNKEPVPFDIIIARGSEDGFAKNYTIDPNNIIMKLASEMTPDKSQQELGTLMLKDGVFNFIVGGYNTGNVRVSGISEIQNMRRKAALLKFEHYPMLIDFLRNVVCFCKLHPSPDDADYDLSLEALQADTFGNMLFPA